jgi:GT2 family glycosyltransferase
MRLSVIVTIVDGGSALERCLQSLANQHDAPELDIIVPYDDSVPGIPELALRFPAIEFLSLGRVDPARGPATAAGQHELYDLRRAAGLAAATGGIVAILEDRGVPHPNWARTMAEVHERLPHAVIGGAIENGQDAPLNWAVYFCDFGRYHLPFEAGARRWVSDVNIGYKRRALDLTRELWHVRYHETTVHWALMRAGETLYLTPDLIVYQMRGSLRLSSLMAERFAWGRLFAYTRARESTTAKRMAFAMLAPFLPALLFVRHAMLQTSKSTAVKFVRASPLVFVLLVAWSLGEALGYVTGEP